MATGKALHVLAPNFFPLWDNAIAANYGVSLENGFFQFMLMMKQQVVDLPDELAPGLTALKAIDEYKVRKSIEIVEGFSSLLPYYEQENSLRISR